MFLDSLKRLFLHSCSLQVQSLHLIFTASTSDFERANLLGHLLSSSSLLLSIFVIVYVLVHLSELIFGEVGWLDCNSGCSWQKGSESSQHYKIITFNFLYLGHYCHHINYQYKGWYSLSITSSFTFKWTFKKLRMLSWMVDSFSFCDNWMSDMISLRPICLSSFEIGSLLLRKYYLVHSFIVYDVLSLRTGSLNYSSFAWT